MSTRRKATVVSLRLGDAVSRLKMCQRQRQFSITSQSRCDRATESYLARLIGYTVDADEEARKANAGKRKALFAEAQRIRKAIEAGRPTGSNSPEINHPSTIELVANAALARQSWDKFRNDAEASMKEAVRSLPVYEFAQSVGGFGDLGLGIVIAESGNLSRSIDGFPTVAKLWKRLGLAVIAGERQQRKSDAEQAAAHGYNPRRRAEMWTLADSMFRKQWMSEMAAYRLDIMAHPKARAYVEKNGIDLAALAKDKNMDAIKEIAAKFKITAASRPAGPYGEVYAHRRAATADRGWPPARQNNDAKRVMFKALLRDLWRVWNGMPPRYAEPAEQMAEAAD